MNRFVLTLCLAFLAPLSSALAQQAQSYVSALGDDINPCTRTKPCRTFAKTLSQTASGRILNLPDSGG